MTNSPKLKCIAKIIAKLSPAKITTFTVIHEVVLSFILAFSIENIFLFANKITRCLNIKDIEIILETVTDIYSITLKLSINITFTPFYRTLVVIVACVFPTEGTATCHGKVKLVPYIRPR